MSPADISAWDPSTTSAPSTRWFVLPGDQQGNGSWDFVASVTDVYGFPVSTAIHLSAPAAGDRIAIATLAPDGARVADVQQIRALAYDVRTGVDTSQGFTEELGTLFVDADCNGAAAGGIVRAHDANPTASSNPMLGYGAVIVDRNVYADGSTGSAGSGTPVLTEGGSYSLTQLAEHCPDLRDYGDDVAAGQSVAIRSSALLLVSGLQRVDYFRLAAPGVTAPVRLGGADRIATAIAAAQKVARPSYGWLTAVLGRSDGYADDLAGAVLANALQAPLLLTRTASLDPRVSDYLAKNINSGGVVYVLGGTGAVSAHVVSQIQALGLKTKRLGGADRYATAVAIASQLQPTSECNTEDWGPCSATIADGTNFPDALVATNLRQPILYSSGRTLPKATLDYLHAAQLPLPGLYAVGGPAVKALAASAYQKFTLATYDGVDRYDTAAKVLAGLPTPGSAAMHVAVATGLNFPDALVGGTVGEVVLTRPGRLPSTVASVLGSEAPAISRVYLMGTSDVVSEAVAAQVQQAMTGHDVTTWPS